MAQKRTFTAQNSRTIIAFRFDAQPLFGREFFARAIRADPLTAAFRLAFLSIGPLLSAEVAVLFFVFLLFCIHVGLKFYLHFRHNGSV
jgi:hypothetical protein